MPGPQPRLHLPFANWPAADRHLWQDATRNDDPFSNGPGARLTKSTLHRLWMGWRRFLGFLAITDEAALQIAPAERVTVARVRRFADHLRETNTPYSVACQIDALYGAVRLMAPENDWSWLRAIKGRLQAAAPSGGRRGPVITSLQLRDVGLQLMAESHIEPGRQVRMADAIRFRDGLMIALLGYIPLRHKNLAAIEINKNLIQEGDSCFIIVPSEETKTSTPIDFEVPEVLRPHLATYLAQIRPRMLREPTCNALWVSAKGGALSYSAIGPVVTRHTTQRLGVRISPHDARDAAATTWAIAAPDQIGVARDLLTHSDLRTTTRHYNRARGIEAGRAHAKIIARMRRQRHRNN
jgi:integrase/recombinase XerD